MERDNPEKVLIRRPLPDLFCLSKIKIKRCIMEISVLNRFIPFDEDGFLSDRIKNSILAALIFFIVARYQTMSLNYTIYKVSMIITGILAFVLIINSIKKYNILHYILFIIFAVQMVIIRNPNLLYVYFLALAFIECDMEFVIKVYMISNIVFFISYLLMNIMGIRETDLVKGRNDFGYGNPNGAFIGMFTIWMSYLYLRFDDMDIIDILILFVFAMVMYKQTNTRTGLMTVFAVMIMIPFIKKFNTSNIIMRYLIPAIPIGIAVLSLVIAFVFKENAFLNDVLSSRPDYWNRYLTHPVNGLSLFGHPSDVKEYLFVPKLPFDSGYLTLIYTFGIIGFVVFMSFYTFSVYKLCMENRKKDIIFIISIRIYAFAESMFTDLATNLSIVYIVYAIGFVNLKGSIERRRKCRKA